MVSLLSRHIPLTSQVVKCPPYTGNLMPTRELEGFIKAIFAYFTSPLKLQVTLSQASLKKAPGRTKNLHFCSKIHSAQERDETFMDFFLT